MNTELIRAISAVGLGAMIGSLVGYHGFDARGFWAALGFFAGGTSSWIILHAHEIPGALYRATIAEDQYKRVFRSVGNFCVNAVPYLLGIVAIMLINYVVCYAGYVIFESVEKEYLVRYEKVLGDDLIVMAISASVVCSVMCTLAHLDEHMISTPLSIRKFLIFANPLAIAIMFTVIVCGAIAHMLYDMAWKIRRFFQEVSAITIHTCRATARFVRAIPWFVRTTRRVIVETVVSVHTHLSSIVFICAGLGGGVGAYFYGNFTLGVAVGFAAALLDFVWVRPAVLRLRS